MRVVCFGDAIGIPQLFAHFPDTAIIAIVGASIRPQYLQDLQQQADREKIPFLIQPHPSSDDYEDFLEAISQLDADLICVNSYSMIIRSDVTERTRFGGVNLHAAMLPRNRGCNPIQWAIINGDSSAGVSLHEITPGIDQGPVIDQIELDILLEDTWITLRDRLANATSELLKRNIHALMSGNWTAQRQNEELATYGRRRTAADGEFLWTEPVIDIYNKIRGLLPPIPPAFFKEAKTGAVVEISSFKSLSEVFESKLRTLSGQIFSNDDTFALKVGKKFFSDSSAKKRSPTDVLFTIEHKFFGDTFGKLGLNYSDYKERAAIAFFVDLAPNHTDKNIYARAFLLTSVFIFQELRLNYLSIHIPFSRNLINNILTSQYLDSDSSLSFSLDCVHPALTIKRIDE